ncbi:uncharacterized protein LACBIDRAFT_305175 [Laccaria bicolor S238N-H82]|uniref:Predicted protein n=1 Tax=Laccaria bicolor (strain S238N-H82 / ATCC MYA-4686) TaxID=486041 RepID=B0CTL6_LACBS|nr:uncharacterized protein LACBIDRAFT_305175 [Laccaria bicolor S238N-H82]EDR14514.1 predicted protein [Laccaria bicolor S238N-H82]|eukprot:XP_001875073.1 predicted protein [Laccaria bicolor S238N-H82]
MHLLNSVVPRNRSSVEPQQSIYPSDLPKGAARDYVSPVGELQPQASTFASEAHVIVDPAPVDGLHPHPNVPNRPPFADVPISPTSEYPDMYGPPVPEYRYDARDDPNASFSFAPMQGLSNGYAESLAPQYDAPEAGGTQAISPSAIYDMYDEDEPERPPYEENPEPIRVTPAFQESFTDVSTFMSGNYPLLRRPSESSSLSYLTEQRPESQNSRITTSDAPTSEWNPIVEVTVNRANTESTYDYASEADDWHHAGPSNLSRRVTNDLRAIVNFEQRLHLELHEEEPDDWYEQEEDFIDLSLLSNLAVQLQLKITRGTHVKGSIPYPRAFTAKDIVSTIQSIIQKELLRSHGVSVGDRRAALQVSRSLQTQLFFYEVEWGGRVLQDGVEDVYMFLDDPEGATDGVPERAELPSGVVTMLTKCYSPSCGEGPECYAYGCPRKGLAQLISSVDVPTSTVREDWSKSVPAEVMKSLPESEINRQTIIHKMISKEEQYLEDLDIVESVYIKPLRYADPPVMSSYVLEEFIEEVFGNILELRECNRRLLEVMYVRQREQAPVIQRVGDIFLDAATEFRIVYPTYVGHHPLAEKRLKEEVEQNPEFRLFMEKCSRKLSTQSSGAPRLDLKHYLNRPAEHLQKYPVLLDAVYHETEVGNPDGDFLREAIAAIKNLHNVAQLRTFQSAMGKGVTGKWEWHDLLSSDTRKTFTKSESQRQSLIFELIKGEMAYVRDLENLENMYLRPLRNAEPPIIPTDRLDQFTMDVLHNFSELHAHHRRLVDNLHEIQREEHPRIRSITAAVFDAALNFREAYMEYIPNYPIAAYRIDDEMANNPAFKTFVEHAIRHPDAHRLDIKAFINRPIPRLLRYELLLKQILGETSAGSEDRSAIPQVIEVISALAKETEPGVASAKQKVELWKYNSNLVFKPGESVDMDLLNEQRSLIHTGKLLRQPDSGVGWEGWTELFVLLFDNYMVMTKPREKDGVTKYHVHRRPIPLDLLSIVNFTDPSTQRGSGLLRTLRTGDSGSISSSRAPDNISDSRAVYPFTIHYNGRLGGPYILFAESAQARSEWKPKLEEALGLRKVVQESNKVFEIETLSIESFLVPSLNMGPTSSAWHDGTLLFTGKVTCSVPFSTPNGRGLVAIGCAEGVWIGFRHDSRSMRRVLHVKMVTQCAMLEDFGLFLVLADKSLFAYHIEALVPTSTSSIHASQAPQKINGSKEVQFFSVGTLHGRTLVIYMNKKGNDSVFHVVEPVIDKINERPKAPGGLSILGRRSNKSEWFRSYREFVLSSESYDLIFLKAKIAVLCTKGFEIMDLTDFKSVTIPQKEDPRYSYLTKRCDSCRPLGMFRPNDDEFLLCYNEFGIFVDKQGHPSRTAGLIEWEGTAERVAFHPPYILLFDTRFIEIRRVETGRLSQIIPGNDVRCVWDGRSMDLSLAASPPEGSDENMSQEPRVHAVMNATEPTAVPHGGGRQPRGIAQHVFELIPTIPLYLPGSLASPSTTYFPRTFSPPRSPQLRPTMSYRS